MRSGKLLIALTLGILYLHGLQVYAQVQAHEPVSAPTQEAPNPGTISGGVVKIEVVANDFKDARLSVSRVRKAAANLYDEMTREEVAVNYTPNVVGMTVITTPMPAFTGRYLPPRKKWVDASMAEIGPIIKLFREDVDIAIENNRRADVSDPAREALAPIREEIFATVKKSSDIYQLLERMTGGQQAADSASVATQAKELDKQMRQLDKLLKQGLKILQKEAKAGKK